MLSSSCENPCAGEIPGSVTGTSLALRRAGLGLGLAVQLGGGHVLHQAVALLRSVDLEDAYAEAWREWDSQGDAGPDGTGPDDTGPWEATSADGIADAAR